MPTRPCAPAPVYAGADNFVGAGMGGDEFAENGHELHDYAVKMFLRQPCALKKPLELKLQFGEQAGFSA